jgi:glycosyltransferase involved in cell wall biosynthesis
MNKIDLVFRTVGERTSKIALDLAIKNIQPDRVYLIENVRPFSLAVQQMLKISYQGDFVVFMDADCLIIEEMITFLQENSLPYIDCYVLDKFRGYIHCGVHINRRDVVEAMQQLNEPSEDPKYVIRPESRWRDLALSKLKLGKAFKRFGIYHDFLQFYQDIFVKYALREIRSRTDYHRAKLNASRGYWKKQENDGDFQIANYAIEYTRKYLKINASTQEIAQFIADLPQVAIRELSQQKISEKAPLTSQEFEDLSEQFKIAKPLNSQDCKIFGIGLSETGTKPLAEALNILGFKVAHYLDDEITLKELMSGKYDFSLLNEFDGITDITVAPFYTQLDKLYPNSKFILTIRDKESWLKSIKSNSEKDGFEGLPSNKNTMELRRQLREAVYGTYTFNKEQFAAVYETHYKNVRGYFKYRPKSLLIINIYAGEGWEKLCPFLNQPIPEQPF